MADLKSIRVIYHTETDDKDKEETIATQIFRGKRLLGESINGGNQVWTDQSDQTVMVTLKRPIQEEQASEGRIVVTKSCHGSPTGCGWDMTVEVYGVADDGVESELVSRTSKVRMGDNNPISRQWAFSAVD